MFRKAKRETNDCCLFERDMDLMPFCAIPYESDVVFSNEHSNGERHYCFLNDVNDVLGYVCASLFTKTKAKIHLVYVRDEEKDLLRVFSSVNLRYIIGDKAVSEIKPVKMRVQALGIRPRQIRRLRRKLNSITMDLRPSELARYAQLSDLKAAQGGKAVYWLKGNYCDKLTEPYNLINACDAKLLAIRTMKYIENCLNNLLQKNDKEEWCICIPTYSEIELMEAGERFIRNELSLSEFSKTIFKLS